MKQLPLIAGALFCEPWGILPAVHASMCLQFRDYLAGHGSGEVADREAVAALAPTGAATDEVGPKWRNPHTGESGFWHEQVRVIGDTAILPVKGILGKHLSTLAMWCGGCDMALLAKQARNITNDPSIRNVVAYIDSPGGSCAGAAETAAAFYAMSQAGKRTVAYTDRLAASNGYFLAAACQAVVASPSAIVGSISTYSAFLDESRAFEMEGLEMRVFKSGSLKTAGLRGTTWSDEEKADMQRVVDQFSDQFKGFVRERRGLKDEDMQGQYWPAEFAPKGMVDDLQLELEDVLAALR